MDVKTNIALVGFMGTGKSTIGKALADRLSKAFIDTDDLVQERLGASISQVFASQGEQFFRRLEARVIETVAEMDNVVIAVGGGAVENAQVRDVLRERCTVVLLTVDVATILERTEGITGRPLLDGFDPEQKRARIIELMHSRASAYNKVYDIVVDASGGVGSTVETISSLIQRACREKTASGGGAECPGCLE